MVNSGFIMLYRDFVDWEWYTDTNTCTLFIHCLIKANFSEKRWQGNLIKKGEFITSYEKLAVETGLTISKVRTALTKLESTGDVFIETTSAFTKIRLPNLKKFIVESNIEQIDNQNSTPNDTPISKGLTIDSQADSIQLATTNTNNNIIRNRKKIFRDTVFSHSSFNIKILESFFDYWSELSTDETKMRFEAETFFEIEKRLKKWAANERQKKTATKTKPELQTNR